MYYVRMYYVCMYFVCTYVCMYYVYVFMYIILCICMYFVCTYVCMYYVYVFMYIILCMCICIFMYTITVYKFYFFEFLYNFLEPKSLCSKIIFGNTGLGATAQNFTEQIMYIYQCHLVDKTGRRPDWGVRDGLLNDIT
jgi:hypothetical protein